jgi:hypothetical protein
VQEILIVAAIIFGINVLPAFAPPTWTVLAYFALTQNLQMEALIIVGVISASSGRWVLANLFRKYSHKLPESYLTNMGNASTHLTKSRHHTRALLALFLISPLSSAQLFEAAGIMRSIALRPLILAFAAGRTFTYSVTVTGANAVAASTFGEVLTKSITSPGAIALQILMIVGLVALGNIKWKPHTPVS